MRKTTGGNLFFGRGRIPAHFWKIKANRREIAEETKLVAQQGSQPFRLLLEEAALPQLCMFWKQSELKTVDKMTDENKR